ncbi:MAG: type II toxin-antitoxin system HigB family toxin [Chitinophagaceae bacterium]
MSSLFENFFYICDENTFDQKAAIEDFVLYNASARNVFQDWLKKIKTADWEKPADMQQTFRSADILGKGSGRVVFDIGGNKYRMICKYVFGMKQVHLFICWIGTHAEYDKICNESIQYAINTS